MKIGDVRARKRRKQDINKGRRQYITGRKINHSYRKYINAENSETLVNNFKRTKKLNN